MLIKLRFAQSTAEYAILLSLVVAAAMGIQNEVRRAIQARIHDAAMELSGGKQYEPASGNKTTSVQKSSRVRNEAFVEPGSDETWITTTDESNAEWDSSETK
ncbi:MAG: hypothetical protein WC546_05080 [Candidatus Omnitrophota bacterium]|jgi:hypothetical protein